MRGYLGLVVHRAFDELWQPLTDHDDCPMNVFGEIYSGLRPYLRDPEPEYVREDDGTIRDKTAGLDDWVALALSDAVTAEELLKELSQSDFESETAVQEAMRSTYGVLSDAATEDLAACYLRLLKAFVERYSLRYYVDDNAKCWITFSGLATAFFSQLRNVAESHPHVLQELIAFEQALAECLAQPVDVRIKTAIQKQINSIEAFGSQHQLVDGNTLGAMLSELKAAGSWPHESLAESAAQLNQFVNDYPGIRHAGTFDSASRGLDLRDLASVTLSLVGLVAYLTDGFESRVLAAIRGDFVGDSFGDNITAPWPAEFQEQMIRS